VYAELTRDASFWQTLIEIDVNLAAAEARRGCPCGGPLHQGNYGRKPRGIAIELQPAFALRHSLCCGWCRARRTPPSLRFLGRRVYAGAIVVLATMMSLVCGAARSTLTRWRLWWHAEFLSTPTWLTLQGLLVPAVEETRLPNSLLQRFEAETGGPSADALQALLRSLVCLSTQSSKLFEGPDGGPALAQKLGNLQCLLGELERSRAPTR
jgi:hypothetical protein